jgi:hypothetical protein
VEIEENYEKMIKIIGYTKIVLGKIFDIVLTIHV